MTDRGENPTLNPKPFSAPPPTLPLPLVHQHLFRLHQKTTLTQPARPPPPLPSIPTCICSAQTARLKCDSPHLSLAAVYKVLRATVYLQGKKKGRGTDAQPPPPATRALRLYLQSHPTPR